MKTVADGRARKYRREKKKGRGKVNTKRKIKKEDFFRKALIN